MLESADFFFDESLPPEEMIRQLKLQRIELELQNQELRRSQEQLEATHERYVDLYFHAPVGYITMDDKGRIAELNFLAAELLGQNRTALLGTSLFDHISAASAPHLQRHLNTLSNGSFDGIRHCKLTVPIGDDLKVHLKMVGINVRDQRNGSSQCRAALFDVTEELNTREDRDNLQEQLRQAHRMEALGRMTSGIAHDFNNLLTLIIGYSKLLINQLPEDDVFARHALQINKAGTHASKLIEQLLTFSRTQSVASSSVAINEIIREMESMFDRLTGDDIGLHLHLLDDLGTIKVDGSQLQQVLMNLVVNAREAMPAGGDLIIRTRHADVGPDLARRLELQPGPYVLIEVEDNGRGIPPELIPEVFEPFFTTKHRKSTHGFGLSTSYRILRQHGGAIDAVSILDQGTTFIVYLPRTDIDSTSQTSEDPRPCVLLVDDQPDLREFASIVLQSLNVELLSAQSPEEALQLARTHGRPIDLVVTDVIMPGLSGPQLVQNIHRTHPEALALYISGHDRETLCLERGIEPGFPFLEKPFCPETLSARVEELLHQKYPTLGESSSVAMES